MQSMPLKISRWPSLFSFQNKKRKAFSIRGGFSLSITVHQKSKKAEILEIIEKAVDILVSRRYNNPV